MKKRTMWVLLACGLAAALLAVVQVFLLAPGRLDNPAAVCSGKDGTGAAAVYDGSKIRIYLLERDGTAREYFSMDRVSGADSVRIADLALGDDGRVYLLRQYVGMTREAAVSRQELLCYTPKFFPWGRIRSVLLDDGTGDVRYNWLSLTTSLIVTGTGNDGTVLERMAYDPDSLSSSTPVVKAARSYQTDPSQGVYDVAPSGADMVYLTKSGRICAVSEGETPRQLYPEAGQTRSSAYALYLEPEQSGTVLFGEYPSGNLCRLYTANGQVEYLREGNQPIGQLTDTYSGILRMSVRDGNASAFTALVQDGESRSYAVIWADESGAGRVEVLTGGLPSRILGTVGRALLYFLLLVVGVFLLRMVVAMIVNSRAILVKLIVTGVPLLCAALALFGVYSYQTYRSSLAGTYETKVADQGNLLRALFGSESFDNLTSPALYRSVEYEYLLSQMETREVHTGSAYYVSGRLYTGPDRELPLLYPLESAQSSGLWKLCYTAALSGKQQLGVIDDRLGERIACITPVGSSSGDTVFLLETSVFTHEVTSQTGAFLRSYVLVAVVTLLVVLLLLVLSFTRILRPLGEIIRGLEDFTAGNRTVRLKNSTNDELADISRVFNKMADDIDVQIYNLKKLSDTYYRFIPQRIFQLLGKQSLSELSLGSSVEGEYSVLSVNLYLPEERESFEEIREMTNRFFAVVHRIGNRFEATLVADSIGLRDLKIICKDAGTALDVAMAALAQVDSYNVTRDLSERLDVSFFLHTANICFSIFGDEERYIPAMVSAELDRLLSQCAELRRISSRLLLTEEARAQLGEDRYYHRFIGSVGEAGTGLYDYYDANPPMVIRLFNETKPTFDKALELFGQGRYYEAKNLFAIVLRGNQYDNVARHYLFLCEQRLGHSGF